MQDILENRNKVSRCCKLKSEDTAGLWLICLAIDFFNQLCHLLLLFCRGINDH